LRLLTACGRHRRADDAKEKVKDQERKKVSYDEKINRRNELVRQIDRLKKENIDKLEEVIYALKRITDMHTI